MLPSAPRQQLWELVGMELIYSGGLIVKTETMGDRWVVRWIKTEEQWNRENNTVEFIREDYDGPRT